MKEPPSGGSFAFGPASRVAFISLAVFMRSLMRGVNVNFVLITGAAERKFR
jgi:hypothetical protein